MSAEGWGYIEGSRKWHYYADGGVSLCRRFMKFRLHNLEQGGDNSPDNCAACRRKLAARRTSAIKEDGE